MDYLEINKDTFKEKIEKNWKNIFENEFQEFGSLFKLFGFLDNDEIIGGFCLGYNPDYFKKKINKVIIDNLNENNYNKISYYFILDKYKGERKGAELLLDFIRNNGGKYFLTCNGDKLRDYYISLGFKAVGSEEDKFILVYEN